MQEVNPATALQTLDGFMEKGVDINCLCAIDKTYRNMLKALGNNIKNALSRFFLNRNANRSNEYYTKKELYTPIYLWVVSENRALIQHAVKKYGADLNKAGHEGIYPVEEAIKANNLEYAKWLINLGASLEYIALCADNLPTIDWLIANGCAIEKADWRCLVRKEEVFLYLLKKYKPNLVENRTFSNNLLKSNLSPVSLDWAFQCGGKPTADLIDNYFNFSNDIYAYATVFDKHGADFTICAFFGCPLEQAVKYKSMNTIKLLAERKALQVKRPICIEDLSMLDFLIKNGFAKENLNLECLLKNPLALQTVITKYQPDLTHLHNSKLTEIHLQSIDVLAKAGLPLSDKFVRPFLHRPLELKTLLAKYPIDLTPLSESDDLKQAEPQSLDLLFSKGVKAKYDLFSYLINFDYQKIMQYAAIFTKYKQDMQSCGFFGCPLQKAIDNNNLSLVKIIVESGADLTIPFKNGQTPLAYAEASKKITIANYLKTK
ncbi:MAG: hypothetical protein OHK0057_31420 [Thermoflexibacter sp.]